VLPVGAPVAPLPVVGGTVPPGTVEVELVPGEPGAVEPGVVGMVRGEPGLVVRAALVLGEPGMVV
jgi:hypothetical protein